MPGESPVTLYPIVVPGSPATERSPTRLASDQFPAVIGAEDARSSTIAARPESPSSPWTVQASVIEEVVVSVAARSVTGDGAVVSGGGGGGGTGVVWARSALPTSDQFGTSSPM